MRRRRKVDPDVIRTRMERRLRFAVLDARRTGLSVREIMETTAKAVDDWRFVNG